MERQSKTKKTVMVNVGRLLTNEQDSSEINEDRKELLLIAREALEAVYNIGPKDYVDHPKVDFVECTEKFEKEQGRLFRIKKLLDISQPQPRASQRLSVHQSGDHHEISQPGPSIGSNEASWCNSENAGATAASPNALEDYRQAVLMNPTYSEDYNKLGILNLCLGRFPDAAKCFDAALKHNPVSNTHRQKAQLERKKLLPKTPPPVPPIPPEFFEAPTRRRVPPPLPPIDFDVGYTVPVVQKNEASRIYTSPVDSDEDDEDMDLHHRPIVYY